MIQSIKVKCDKCEHEFTIPESGEQHTIYHENYGQSKGEN